MQLKSFFEAVYTLSFKCGILRFIKKETMMRMRISILKLFGMFCVFGSNIKSGVNKRKKNVTILTDPHILI